MPHCSEEVDKKKVSDICRLNGFDFQYFIDFSSSFPALLSKLMRTLDGHFEIYEC